MPEVDRLTQRMSISHHRRTDLSGSLTRWSLISLKRNCRTSKAYTFGSVSTACSSLAPTHQTIISSDVEKCCVYGNQFSVSLLRELSSACYCSREGLYRFIFTRNESVSQELSWWYTRVLPSSPSASVNWYIISDMGRMSVETWNHSIVASQKWWTGY